MLQSILYQRSAEGGPDRYYRVEISDNLFGEYTVLREWGSSGGPPCQRVQLCANLREACVAADAWISRARLRGFG